MDPTRGDEDRSAGAGNCHMPSHCLLDRRQVRALELVRSMGWPTDELSDHVRVTLPDDWAEQIGERVRGGARLVPQLEAGIRRARETLL
jgi:hypothetical protein